MKTAKIISTELCKRDFYFKGAKWYAHFITFDNGDNGEFASPNEKCPEFVMGEQVNYTIEPNGGYANKIKLVKTSTGGGRGKSPQEQEAIMKMSVFSSLCNLYSGRGDVAMDKDFMSKEFNFYYNLLKTTK